MAITLSGARREQLDRALDGWRSWPLPLTGRPRPIRRLTGWSNTNVLVQSGSTDLVVRLNDDTRHLGVDRRIEQSVLEDIRPREFAPPIIHIGEDYLVSRFVSGTTPVTLSPGEAASLIAAIHSTPTRVSDVLDPWAQARSYLALATETTDEPIGTLAATVLGLETTPRRPVLTHNDLSPANLIRTGSDLTVIDWEYARLGDPAFDIAALIETHEVSDDFVAQFLARLDETGLDNRDTARRVPAMRLLYLLIETLWWRLRNPAHDRGMLVRLRLEQRLEAR